MKALFLLPALLLGPVANAEVIRCSAHDFSGRFIEIDRRDGAYTHINLTSQSANSVGGWKNPVSLIDLTGRAEDALGLVNRVALSMPQGACAEVAGDLACETKGRDVQFSATESISEPRPPVQREAITKQVRILGDVKMKVELKNQESSRSLGQVTVTVTEPAGGRTIESVIVGGCESTDK